jgi:hypothetical protein
MRPIYSAMVPHKVRLYTYAILAIVFLVHNFEAFSRVPLIRHTFWNLYSGVIVEVLLTDVAIDGVVSAWREIREPTPRAQ